MLCAIWYHLYNFKNTKNTHGGVLLLVKVTLLHGCFHIFKIAQMVPNRATHHIIFIIFCRLQGNTPWIIAPWTIAIPQPISTWYDWWQFSVGGLSRKKSSWNFSYLYHVELVRLSKRRLWLYCCNENLDRQS